VSAPTSDSDDCDHTRQPDYTAIPFGDLASRTILEVAVLDLTLYRGGQYGDPGATISVLVSLDAEAQAWLIEAVADARDFGYSWDRIAERLGSTVSAARHRYAAYAAGRRNHPLSAD